MENEQIVIASDEALGRAELPQFQNALSKSPTST
jgi:hypothetical protein